MIVGATPWWNFDLSTSLLLLGVTLAISLLLRSQAKRNKRRPAPAPPAATFDLKAHELASDLEVQLHERCREMVGLLDTKTRALEILIRDADDRLARLQQVAANKPLAGPPSTDAEKSDENAEPLVIEMERSRINLAGGQRSRPGGDRARHESIYRLADQGLSAEEIGAQTRQSVAEVELILGLRRARGVDAPAENS